MTDYRLNTESPKIMHIDLNSAFASAEQQAWPNLRGKPMGVTNRLSKECCVIAASYEAKALGIKVGMRRSEALAICPEFVLVETDPNKYTWMYKNLLNIMKDYSPKVRMKSIDEGVIDFNGTENTLSGRSLVDVGYEIKQRVYEAVGRNMRINVGIGTNLFLAKMAAGLHKPDGLDLLDHHNLVDMYKSIELEDIHGIASGYGRRLRMYGIMNPIQFLEADAEFLRRSVFCSIEGARWHSRLRGFEVDGRPTKLGMIGRQWVVGGAYDNDDYLRSCLHFLAETTGMKLRYRGVEARGVCVWLVFGSGGRWKEKRMYASSIYSNQEIWKRVLELFERRPKYMKVKVMGVYLYGIEPSMRSQLGLFEDTARTDRLTRAMDDINDYYGSFSIYSADTIEGKKNVKQKIPFGGTEYFDLLLKRA